MAKEITQDSPKINNLVKRIEFGEVKIPPLQRPFVWKIEQVIDLLESVYKDYPIGSILLWETSDKLPSERNIAGFKLPERPKSHPFYYVLDGQQRLSSLYGVFCIDRTIDPDIEKEYKVDTDIFNILFDLVEKKFIHKSQKEDGRNYFDLKSLFNISAYSNALIKASPSEKDTIQDLYEKFTNYEIPIIITKKRELEEVGIIFERVNNTGTKLDLFDLMVALTWTKEFHLQNEFKKIHAVLEKKNFKGIKNKIILQCLSSIIKESSGVKVITSLKGQDIRDNIKNLKESLKKAVDYLSTELSVKSRQLLPHAHQIVPLCYVFSKINTPTVKQKKIINQWFWATSFSERFTESTDRHIDEDVTEFKKLVEEGSDNAFKSFEYAVSSEQLLETKFLRSNAYSRAFVVLLANQQPKDLTNGVKVDTGEALSCFNSKEYHHIFPKKFLTDKNIKAEKINSLCNFCILPSDSNKKISNKAPSDYFFNIIPENHFKEILQSNILPIKISLYKDDDFDNFLKERSIKIIEFLEKQLI